MREGRACRAFKKLRGIGLHGPVNKYVVRLADQLILLNIRKATALQAAKRKVRKDK